MTTLDLSSFLIGFLVGAVAAFLLKLNALRRLDLNLRKIGITLGVEGLEQPEPSGVKIGDVEGNISGDIAGRDINKTSNLYKTVKAALHDAAGGTLADSIRIRRPERIQLKRDDPAFAQRLEEIRKREEDWFPRWIEECLNDPALKGQLDAKIQELKLQGWTTTVLGLDNIPGGLHVNLEVERAYD